MFHFLGIGCRGGQGNMVGSRGGGRGMGVRHYSPRFERLSEQMIKRTFDG